MRAGALSLEQLPEYAPQGPHVHRSGVLALGHDHLGRAVARGGDDAGEHLALRETLPVVRERHGRAPTVRAPVAPLSRAAEKRHLVVVAVAVAPRHVPGIVPRPRRAVPSQVTVPTSRGAPREAKVANLHDAAAEPVPPAEDVRRLDVPVPHPHVVEVLHRARQLVHQRSHLVRAHVPSQAVQVPARGVLEGHVHVDGHGHQGERIGIQHPRARRGGGVEDAEDLDDVRVVQAVQDDDLAEDPARGVDRLERVRDSLQRDDAPGASVERFAHRTERSAAEEGEEPVPGPDLPRVDVSGVLVLRASRGTERGSSGAGNEGREGRRFGISHPSSERFRPGRARISAR